VGCPQCHRPVAVAQPRCLYCGAALPAEVVARAVAALEAPAEQAPKADAECLVLDLRHADPARVADALELGLYDAGQRILHGIQLYRVVAAEEARRETQRLSAFGLDVISFPVSEANAAGAPQHASTGSLDGPLLTLRTERGHISIEPGQLLLIVHGPIQRQHQGPRPKITWGLFKLGAEFGLPSPEVGTATLETGYRYHLYRGDDPQPLELNPAVFTFVDGPVSGESASRRLALWLLAASASVATDDRFRHLPPVFAPTADAGLALMVTPAGRQVTKKKTDTTAVVDNLGQFRFYSGWRAAAERRRAR
jgi:hypothetical protein